MDKLTGVILGSYEPVHLSVVYLSDTDPPAYDDDFTAAEGELDRSVRPNLAVV